MRQQDKERNRGEEKREGGREAANGSFCDTTRSREGEREEREQRSNWIRLQKIDRESCSGTLDSF